MDYIEKTVTIQARITEDQIYAWDLFVEHLRELPVQPQWISLNARVS